MNEIKDFLLQLALITILIFTYHIFFEERSKRNNIEKIIASALCGLSILLCMSFRTNVNSYISLDIRIVPLLLGTLYIGTRTGLFLSALIILYRLFLGIDLGFYNTILTILTAMPAFLFFQKIFVKGKKNKRIQIALILSIYYCLAGLTWSSILRGASLKVLQVQIIHLIFTVVVVWFFTSLIENIKEIILKNQQLQSEAERVRVISDLTSVFAHEIRNPMQITRGFLQLLNQPELSDKMKEYIKYSIDEIDRANAIINDLLAFGKPITTENPPIEVASELRRLENIIQTYALSRNVEIKTVYHDDCWIHANPQKLNQSLINILKNAIESMPNGGTIWLTCSPKIDGFIEISVKDQGIGMTKDQIDKLGSPFYSLKENGTGLGMMVSLQIIRNLQGKVQINSEKDVGTEFSIYLPQIS